MSHWLCIRVGLAISVHMTFNLRGAFFCGQNREAQWIEMDNTLQVGGNHEIWYQNRLWWC
ncbi:hypothetical protein V6Z12_D09G078700 [Gossypium hirsutum]